MKDSLPILLAGRSPTLTLGFRNCRLMDRKGNLVTSLFNQGKDTIDLKARETCFLICEIQPDGRHRWDWVGGHSGRTSIWVSSSGMIAADVT